jgi:hypothetical protein
MTAEEKRERAARRRILANFQFYVDERVKEVFEGITLDVSDSGYRFLTETDIRTGQTVTITSHALRDFSCPKAIVTWARKGTHCFEAAAEKASDLGRTAG